MRLGVLNVGSNTIHLVTVDARRGGHPTPVSDSKSTMKLVEYLDKDNNLSKKGIDKLTGYVAESKELVEQMKCEETIDFAISAVRDATNTDDVLTHVENETSIKLQIPSGENKAQLIFLAVRRWYGWSAGRLINLDIGGGSLELTSGTDEDLETAYSLLFGVGRLTHEWFETDPPERKKIDLLRDYIDTKLAELARHLRTLGKPDLAIATSKTFRTLARLTGAAPSAADPRVKRTLTAAGLRQSITFISRVTAADRAELEGVNANRSHRIVVGVLVAEASMRALGLEKVEICPWALRESIIFRRLDNDLYGKG